MKFHCDRCKTKYSISDDRVRGKILKIRCKNCSGVITVREPGTAAPGMPAAAKPAAAKSAAARPAVATPAPAQAAAPQARARKTTAGQQALAGAFKKAVNDPDSSAANMRAVSSPVSLEAEWYLSKDGAQEGPFNLEEARSWVSSKKPEDELYCWSEGYDDWLPIEKVSHFRGIRAATFSDLGGPDEQTMIDSGLAFDSPLETPKPLFAATMAAVSDGQKVDDEVRLPQAAAAPVRAASAPPIPSAAKAAARAPSFPSGFAATEVAPIPTPTPAPAMVAKAAAAPAPVAAAAPAAAMAPAPSPTPAAAAPAPVAAAAPSGDLDIGEASRVVDLAALMANRGNAPAGYPSSPGLPGTNARPIGSGSGAAQALSGTGGMPSITGGPEVPTVGVLEARKKRSSLLIPLIGVGLVVALGAGVLIYMMGSDSERRIARGTVGGGNLGYTIDKKTGKRTPKVAPEVTPEVVPEDTGKKPNNRRKWTGSRTNGTGGTGGTKVRTTDPNEVDLSGGTTKSAATGPLDGDDLMRTYRKNELGIKLCYESSLKKNPLLKVPKTQVTISVGKDGKVKSVKIPTLAGTPLGNCMASRIARWKFRESTEVFNSKFPVLFGR
jgi:predicted Zn finger-like uncharacterized protein